MFCITTSTKYHDLLQIIIPQNHRFFDKWYIVTHPDDHQTIDLVHDFNYSNVELLFFNFYSENRVFNKGGAIRMVQQMIPTGEKVLLLDSDIYLPNNFLEVLPDLDPNKLYSSDLRYEYYSQFAFKNNTPDKIDVNHFFGFFQLYTQTPERLYEESEDAGICDNTFKQTFYTDYHRLQVRIPKLILKHLGRGATHWQGRNTQDFN